MNSALKFFILSVIPELQSTAQSLGSLGVLKIYLCKSSTFMQNFIHTDYLVNWVTHSFGLMIADIVLDLWYQLSFDPPIDPSKFTLQKKTNCNMLFITIPFGTVRMTVKHRFSKAAIQVNSRYIIAFH